MVQTTWSPDRVGVNRLSCTVYQKDEGTQHSPTPRMYQHHEETRNNWVHLNKHDVSNSWAAPSVGIFWCNQSS
eukprot:13707656-Heterocapsa_arctica.AAC.1